MKSQLAVGSLDVFERGIFLEAQDGVVVVEWVGIVLIEELLFVFVAEPMLIEESLESRVGIFEAVLMAK